MKQTVSTFEENLLREFENEIIPSHRKLHHLTGHNIDSAKSSSFSFPVPLSFNGERLMNLAKSYFGSLCESTPIFFVDEFHELTMRCSRDSENFLVSIILPPGKLIVNITIYL
jgi:hypothetical protein